MQRWEYCTLQRRACTPARWYLTVYRAKVPLDRVFRPGEAARERGLHDVWARTLARLGREGWELVAANGAGFHFKRPAPSHTAPILQTAVLGDTAELPAASPETQEGGPAEPGRVQGAARAATVRGRIAWLHGDRGVDFIAPDQRDWLVAFHAGAVEGRAFEALREGQLMEYDAGGDPRSPVRQRAQRVRGIAE
jgi:cold shock CspA family protein